MPSDDKPHKDVIFYDTNEAAQFKKDALVSGWVCRNGLYHGNDENRARLSGATHKICRYHREVYNLNGVCESCNEMESYRKYIEFPIKEDWDFPLCLWDRNLYFFEWFHLYNFCNDTRTPPSALRLTSCYRTEFEEVELEIFSEVVAENQNYSDLPDKVLKALDEFNKVLKENKPNCWFPNDERVILTKDHDETFLKEYKPKNWAKSE